MQYHQAGKLAEAESCYRKILAIDPSHFDSLHLLGVVAHQSGRSDLAADLISKAISARDRGLDDKEISSRLNFRDRKQTIGPREVAVALGNLSIVLMSLGRDIEALRAIQRSLQLAQTENTKLLFVQCLRALDAVPEDIDLRDNLGKALSEPWGRPIYLGRFAANIIKRNGKTAAHMRRFAAGDTNALSRPDLIDPIELADLSSDRLLRTVLETTVISDIDLERYLTAVRRAMLVRACVETPE
ncbi:MAG: hypothetical protein WAV27_06055, partial [Xanthobacteraceae bacterium]